jgi:hypothetical protein
MLLDFLILTIAGRVTKLVRGGFRRQRGRRGRQEKACFVALFGSPAGEE